MAEGPSQGCCAAVALVPHAGAKALLPACCPGRGLRCPGFPAGQQTSGSRGGGDPAVGTLMLRSNCFWWLVPTDGMRLLEKRGTYPCISIFQTEWSGTPQTQYWGADEGRGRKQGRQRSVQGEVHWLVGQ